MEKHLGEIVLRVIGPGDKVGRTRVGPVIGRAQGPNLSGRDKRDNQLHRTGKETDFGFFCAYRFAGAINMSNWKAWFDECATEETPFVGQ